MDIVQDYIDENDGDIKILIDRLDPYDKYEVTHLYLWEGLIKDIPEEYRNLEVISSGWKIFKQIHCLTVKYP